MRIFIATLLFAFPFSTLAKTAPEILEREAAMQKQLDTAARLNVLAAKMSEASAAEITVPPVAQKLRPPQISFVEQRNLIALEAVERRRDWYRHLRLKLNAGESLAPEPDLARLYFAYLQAQIQIDRDDAERIKRLVAEAEFEANKAQAKHDFNLGLHAALADGTSLNEAYNKRLEHLGEIFDSNESPADVLDRDFRESSRDQARTAKTRIRLQAEAEKIAQDLELSETLVAQAKAAAEVFPQELQTAFHRPEGYPVLDRQGHFYSESEWREMSEAFTKTAPAPTNGIKASCARLMARMRAKGQG